MREAVIEHLAEAKSLESQLKQYQGVDWNALVDSDPIQAMKLDRQYRELQSAYSQKVNDIQAAQQNISDQRQHFTQELLQREKQSMLEAIPDWKDAEKSKSERAEIKASLQKAGFTPEEIENLSDHRSVVIARKAMLYDQMMSKKPEVQKRVSEAPKPVKPGTTQQRNQKGDAYNKTRAPASVVSFSVLTPRNSQIVAMKSGTETGRSSTVAPVESVRPITCPPRTPAPMNMVLQALA